MSEKERSRKRGQAEARNRLLKDQPELREAIDNIREIIKRTEINQPMYHTISKLCNDLAGVAYQRFLAYEEQDRVPRN